MDKLQPLAIFQPWDIPRLTEKWRQMKGATNAELGLLLGHLRAMEAFESTGKHASSARDRETAK